MVVLVRAFGDDDSRFADYLLCAATAKAILEINSAKANDNYPVTLTLRWRGGVLSLRAALQGEGRNHFLARWLRICNQHPKRCGRIWAWRHHPLLFRASDGYAPSHCYHRRRSRSPKFGQGVACG